MLGRLFHCIFQHSGGGTNEPILEAGTQPSITKGKLLSILASLFQKKVVTTIFKKSKSFQDIPEDFLSNK